MPKKLTDLVKEAPEAQLAWMIKDSAGQIWLAGLGAFAKAQKEGVKVFELLVAEGEKFQEQTKTAADDGLAESARRRRGPGTSSRRCSRIAWRARSTA